MIHLQKIRGLSKTSGAQAPKGKVKCPQLSTKTAARNQISIGDRMEKKTLGRNQAQSGDQFSSGQTNQQFVPTAAK